MPRRNVEGRMGFSALRSLKKITNEKDKPEIGSLQGVGLTGVIK